MVIAIPSQIHQYIVYIEILWNNICQTCTLVFIRQANSWKASTRRFVCQHLFLLLYVRISASFVNISARAVFACQLLIFQNIRRLEKRVAEIFYMFPCIYSHASVLLHVRLNWGVTRVPLIECTNWIIKYLVRKYKIYYFSEVC